VAKRKTTRKAVPLAPYRKHQGLKEWDRKIVKSTRHGDARFKPGLPHDEAYYASLYLDDESYPIPADIDPDEAGFFWRKMSHIVGASRGVQTKYIMIKVDRFGTHVRPISRHELINVFGVTGI
jgi:hypothetical protein